MKPRIRYEQAAGLPLQRLEKIAESCYRWVEN